MSNKKKYAIPIVLLLTVSACSELQQYRNSWPALATDDGRGADYWLAESHATRGMTADQQRQILESREKELRNNPNSSNRLRVALLLAAGSEEIRDQRRALTLLEELDLASYSVSDQEMVTVFRQLLVDQRKANRKIYILWKHDGEQSQQIGDLDQQLTEQRQRVEELEQQLQALTTIEQKIQQRESPAAGRSGDYIK